MHLQVTFTPECGWIDALIQFVLPSSRKLRLHSLLLRISDPPLQCKAGCSHSLQSPSLHISLVESPNGKATRPS